MTLKDWVVLWIWIIASFLILFIVSFMFSNKFFIKWSHRLTRTGVIVVTLPVIFALWFVGCMHLIHDKQIIVLSSLLHFLYRLVFAFLLAFCWLYYSFGLILNFLFYHRNDILQVVIAIKIKVASCSWGRPVYHQLRRWKLWRWSGSWASTAPTFTKKVQANASVGNWLCLDDVGNEA